VKAAWMDVALAAELTLIIGTGDVHVEIETWTVMDPGANDAAMEHGVVGPRLTATEHGVVGARLTAPEHGVAGARLIAMEGGVAVIDRQECHECSRWFLLAFERTFNLFEIACKQSALERSRARPGLSYDRLRHSSSRHH
jgi:hypothetical protein